MTIAEMIAWKRDGAVITATMIDTFMDGVVSGEIPDYQLSAFLMAVFFRGFDESELFCWTDAMCSSGECLDLRHLDGPVIDKHSTGGVGDKISICLAPLIAACGVYVPMIAGRGLGHSGGTLDKLEAIPGFSTDLPTSRFAEIVEKAGFAFAGQSEAIAPADRKLYALRDVTGTVESIPLIASSIMSKKLAEDLDGLVLDVKLGNGAFMPTRPRALALVKALMTIGQRSGVKIAAVLSDMNQPLGRAIGNANETAEAIAILHGEGPADVWRLCKVLGGEMLRLAGLVLSASEGERRLCEARDSGSGLERLAQVISLQGGDPKVIERPELLGAAKSHLVVCARDAGYLKEVNTRRLGQIALRLGAGRATAADTIDPQAGMVYHPRLGDRLCEGDPLVTLAFEKEIDIEQTCTAVREAFVLEQGLTEDQGAPHGPPLIYEIIREDDSIEGERAS